MSAGSKPHPEVLANCLSLHHFMEVLIEFLAKNVLRQGLVRVKRLLLQTHRTSQSITNQNTAIHAEMTRWCETEQLMLSLYLVICAEHLAISNA